jgi:hypothetical protein
MNIVLFIFASFLVNYTIIDSVDVGNYANGVAFGSGYVWAIDNGVDDIFKIDPNTMNIISTKSYPGGLDGLGYDGEYLWIGIWSSSIHKVDTAGNCIDTWPSPGATYSYGMAFDGTYLWHSDKNLKVIYKLDYNDPTIVYESFSVTWTPRDLGWYRNHLWATANSNTIYELEPSDMSIIDSWPSGRPNTAGIALGGGYLWFGSNASQDGKVYKVDLPLGIEEIEFTATSCPSGCRLNWNVNLESNIVEYAIRRKLEEEAYYVNITSIPVSGSSPSPKSYSYIDEDVEQNKRYFYKLGMVDLDNNVTWYGPVSVFVRSMEDYLKMEPNPFRDKVTINLGMYDVGFEMYETSLNIYNISGRLVKSLPLTANHSALSTAVTWDGKDDRGRVLPQGIYFLELKSRHYSTSRKLVKIK